MKPIHKMVLLLFAVVIPYLALAFLIMWGRQIVPVWGRIVLGSSLLVVVIVLVVGGKAILVENQQETSDLSRRSGPVRFVFMIYAVGIPLVLVGILAKKKWEDIPPLIVPVLLAFFLWKWLKNVESRPSGDPSTKR